ncbi:tetratricopeptide repeat protein [Polluticoccus soli]|uniref:tetratricopeptide repeat protein n=1 Tax=Polluticoccus soli TaxID=3034150 RepID=UPI0023E245EE|nr:tetratricopeptide repeat protein [Flavipsychrobacter sp. JY13-12]
MRLIALLCILLGSLSVSAKSDYFEQLWQKGNSYYAQKQYDSAAAYFEKLVAEKPTKAEIYYNLGNAYYRLNQIGLAVLNYERALQLDPSNNTAKDNLALTQARISNRIQASPDIFFVSWWKALTSGNKAGAWAIVSLTLFIAFIALLLARRFGKLQMMPVQVVGITAAIWAVCLVFSFFAAQRNADSGQAVVMQNDAPLYADPRAGKSQSLIPEGTTVRWKGSTSGWVEVSLPDGRTGWMKQAQLERI